MVWESVRGIAKSVKVLCDALGIWCMVAICGNNPEKGIKYRHTWNIVKIGGQFYHLDVTFDNTLGKHSLAGQELRYDYFNLEDKKIFRDHEPLNRTGLLPARMEITFTIGRKSFLLQKWKMCTNGLCRQQKRAEC